DQFGFELGLKAHYKRDLSGYLSYAFTRSTVADTGDETGRYPAHLLAIGGEAKLGKFRVGADFHFVDATSPQYLDVKSVKTIRPDNPAQYFLNLHAACPLTKNEVEAFAYVHNLLAVVRDGSDLKQFPGKGNGVGPVGAVFLVGLRIHP